MLGSLVWFLLVALCLRKTLGNVCMPFVPEGNMFDHDSAAYETIISMLNAGVQTGLQMS